MEDSGTGENKQANNRTDSCGPWVKEGKGNDSDLQKKKDKSGKGGNGRKCRGR